MLITYKWTIVQMDAYPEYAGKTDVVFTVHWRLDGTDGVYVGGVYGSVGVTPDENAAYTPYADLTEEQVVGWVEAALGEEQVAAYHENIAKQIVDQAIPPVVTPPLPWAE